MPTTTHKCLVNQSHNFVFMKLKVLNVCSSCIEPKIITIAFSATFWNSNNWYYKWELSSIICHILVIGLIWKGFCNMVVALDHIINLNKLACMFSATNDRIRSNSRIGLDLFTNNCLEYLFFSIATRWTKFALYSRSNQYCG